MLTIRRYLSGRNIPPPQPADTAKAGDICFYDLQNNQKIIVAFDQYKKSQYPIGRYYPLGVVVVPSSHDVYGSGECGVMSLNWMTPLDYKQGGEQYTMLWSNDDYYVAFRYDGVPLLPDLTSNTFDNYKYYIGVGLVPYQGGSLIPTGDMMDKQSGYMVISGRDWYIPSPYLSDGSKNAAFHQVSFQNNGQSRLNVLADYNGKEHTLEVVHNTVLDRFLPFKCCYNYSPIGTEIGDWYVPTIGELCYMMPKFRDIQTTINTIIQDYGIGYSLDSGMLWSCNGYTDNEYSKYILILNENERGLCTYTYGQNNSRSVRAFLRVNV